MPIETLHAWRRRFVGAIGSRKCATISSIWTDLLDDQDRASDGGGGEKREAKWQGRSPPTPPAADGDISKSSTAHKYGADFAHCAAAPRIRTARSDSARSNRVGEAIRWIKKQFSGRVGFCPADRWRSVCFDGRSRLAEAEIISREKRDKVPRFTVQQVSFRQPKSELSFPIAGAKLSVTTPFRGGERQTPPLNVRIVSIRTPQTLSVSRVRERSFLYGNQAECGAMRLASLRNQVRGSVSSM